MNTQLVIKKQAAGVTLSKSDIITLNAQKRKLLISMVPEIIDMKKEQTLVDNLLIEVTDGLNKFIKQQLPEQDMAVLMKYNGTRSCSTINITKETHQSYDKHKTISHTFNVETYEKPQELSSYSDYNSQEWRCVPLDLLAKCEEYIALLTQFDIIKQQKIQSYVSLIKSSKTLNEVATVWEDVADYLKGDIVTKVAVVNQITNEEIATVQEDVNRRATVLK